MMPAFRPLQVRAFLHGMTAARPAADWLFGLMLLITTLAVVIPLSPAMPWEGLDPSWIFSMNQAEAQGLVFGRDLIFTFGPYASIYTSTYHPGTDTLMLLGSLCLAVGFFLALYLNFRTSRWYVKAGLWAVLAGITYSRDALLFFYPILIGVWVIQSVQPSEPERDRPDPGYGWTWVLFIPFGLLPLIKGSLLLACWATVVLSALAVWKSGNRNSAVAICLTAVVSLVLFWMMARQPLAGLPRYLGSMFFIIQGYTEAMSLSGKSDEVMAYLSFGIFIIWAVARQSHGARFSKAMLASAFALIIFLSLKAGFVRHDFHALIPATMCLYLGLLAATLTSGWVQAVCLIAGLTAWHSIDENYRHTRLPTWVTNLTSTYQNSWKGLTGRLTNPDGLNKQFGMTLANIHSHSQFPLLSGTTDIYSFDQSFLFASGNSWNPRPILQSYSADTPELLQINRDYLLGDTRPDNIIFRIQPIDRRLPSLEDGLSWPFLLTAYQPGQLFKGYLFLKQRTIEPRLTARLAPLSKTRHAFGEAIPIPDTDSPLMARIQLKPSWLGRLASLFYKPSQLQIKLTLQRGRPRTYRLISQMAKTEFMLSPLIENSFEFQHLYLNDGALTAKKVKSIMLVAPENPGFWKDSFKLELMALELPAQPHSQPTLPAP